MESEIWKPVVGYEGLYEVSSLGRVRSVDRNIVHKNGSIHFKKGVVLRPCINENGYFAVALCRGGYSKTIRLHRIVATAFIENPENKPDVDHIDTNRLNCVASNLRWVTRKENLRNPNSTPHYRMSASKEYGSGWKAIETRNRNKSKGAEVPVVQYTMDGVFIKRFRSIAEAARETGVQDASIHLFLKGKIRHAGGFVWKREL